MIEHANTSRSITAETVEMSADEKYLFDLLGFLIVRDVLSEEHLKLANEAIDSMELTPSPEYFGDSVALKGGKHLDTPRQQRGLFGIAAAVVRALQRNAGASQNHPAPQHDPRGRLAAPTTVRV